MEEFEEPIPLMFRLDYFGNLFLGEMIYVDETLSFTGFIQIFDGQVVCNAPTKKSLICRAEEICNMKLTHGMHIFEGRNIKILKTPYYLN